MRTCRDCGRVLISSRAWRLLPRSARRVLRAGHAQAAGRGLCKTCDARHRAAGTLIDFDPIRLSHDEIMDEYAIQRGQGFTDAQIADRLGISSVTLWRHLKKETHV